MPAFVTIVLASNTGLSRNLEHAGSMFFSQWLVSIHMGNGTRVELRIDSPEECPVAAVSATTGGVGRSVSRVDEPESDRTIEEFVLESTTDQSAPELTDHPIPIETVFSDASSQVYRFDRDWQHDCPCTAIEEFGHPIADVEAREGALFITCYVSELDDIRTLLTELWSQYTGMSVERLIRSDADQGDSTLVYVDRAVLTDRQAEVLETALEMGYFEHPKAANAGDVADELGINRSTFAEHLAAAQRKLLPNIVSGDSG